MKKSRYILADFGGFDWVGPLDPTPDQLYCIRVLSSWRRGSHHLGGKIRPAGLGIELISSLTPCTFDFPELTTLVLFAHRYHMRVEISSHMRYLSYMCHRRKPKAPGCSTWDYHPSIDDLGEMVEKAKKWSDFEQPTIKT